MFGQYSVSLYSNVDGFGNFSRNEAAKDLFDVRDEGAMVTIRREKLCSCV